MGGLLSGCFDLGVAWLRRLDGEADMWESWRFLGIALEVTDNFDPNILGDHVEA